MLKSAGLKSLFGAVSFGVVSAAQAASLGGAGTADDAFKVWISSDLQVQDAELVFQKTSSWGSTGSFSGAVLPEGGNLFLLVQAVNNSGPAMFLADFTLTGTGFTFLNGGDRLSTDTLHWKVGVSDFATATGTPANMGANQPGLAIWGVRPDISSSAQAIWAYHADWSSGQPGSAYFVTQLVSAVPEPGALALMLSGLAGLAVYRRRRPAA